MYCQPKPSTGPSTIALGSYSGSTIGARLGYTHPAAHLHQEVEIDKHKVGGVGVDVNQTPAPLHYSKHSLARCRRALQPRANAANGAAFGSSARARRRANSQHNDLINKPP